MNNTITRDLYWKKRIVAGVLFLVVLISTLCPTIAYAAETETRTVRVSYFEFPGYHDVIEDEYGNLGSGYGFDFLQLLRRYTNLNYQYVGCGSSWQEAQEMLRTGEIDMVTSARKTSQREKEFAFSSPIGTSNAELCVRSDDDRFGLNDYGSFDGMTIGVLKGNSRNGDLAILSQEKGFTYQTVEYEEEMELTAALRNGEVDGIVASSLRKHTGEKIVARFALEEFYVIVRKEDTDLLDEINRGIEHRSTRQRSLLLCGKRGTGGYHSRLFCTSDGDGRSSLFRDGCGESCAIL